MARVVSGHTLGHHLHTSLGLSGLSGVLSTKLLWSTTHHHHHTPIRHNNVSFWFLYLSTYRLEKHNQDTLTGRYSIHVRINKLSFLMTDVRKILFTVTASNNILLCYCFLSCICWVTRRRVCLRVFAGFKSKKLLESNEMLLSFFK